MVVALVHELGRMTLDEVAHLCRHWRRPVPHPQPVGPAARQALAPLLRPWALQLLRPWALQLRRPWAPQLLWPWALQLLRPWALQLLRPWAPHLPQQSLHVASRRVAWEEWACRGGQYCPFRAPCPEPFRGWLVERPPRPFSSRRSQPVLSVAARRVPPFGPAAAADSLGPAAAADLPCSRGAAACDCRRRHQVGREPLLFEYFSNRAVMKSLTQTPGILTCNRHRAQIASARRGTRALSQPRSQCYSFRSADQPVMGATARSAGGCG